MTPSPREERSVIISRRQLLAGLGAVGVAGTFGGAVTGAFNADRETLAARLTTGRVDLVVDWTAYDDEDGEIASGRSENVVSVPFEGLVPGDTGYVELSAVLPDERCEEGAGPVPSNPAYLWLGGACPTPAGTVLAEELAVTLSYLSPDGRVGDALFRGSLRGLGDALSAGLSLSARRDVGGDPAEASPLVPCEPLGFRLDWQLSPAYFGAESTRLDLVALARQTRHVGNANPFDAVEPCAGPDCDCCVAVGKVEFEDELAGAGTYRFGDSGTDWASEGLAEYQLVVSDTVEKTENDSRSTVGLSVCVEGVGDVPDPLLCAVEVKGGAVGSVTYTTDEGTLPGGNCSGRIYAPAKVDEPATAGEFYGVSYVRVSICRPRDAEGECPVDLVRSASRGPPQGPRATPQEPIESDPTEDGEGGQSGEGEGRPPGNGTQDPQPGKGHSDDENPGQGRGPERSGGPPEPTGGNGGTNSDQPGPPANAAEEQQ